MKNSLKGDGCPVGSPQALVDFYMINKGPSGPPVNICVCCVPLGRGPAEGGGAQTLPGQSIETLDTAGGRFRTAAAHISHVKQGLSDYRTFIG